MISFVLASILAASAVQTSLPTSPSPKHQEAFKPFTGKVVANKVRIRVKPDLESHILRQVDKNEWLLIVSETGDFYGVEPPNDTKAYVFRSYILDGVVEASRVNVRLEPHADAPIIGQLQVGEKIQAEVASTNHKWLEIPPPKGTRFFVSKEFVEKVGGPEYLATMQKRKIQVEELLNKGCLWVESECKKPYEEMNPEAAIDLFHNIVRNFADFPESCSQAKEQLAHLKETLLHKKIEYLESKAELTDAAKEELIAKHKREKQELFLNEPVRASSSRAVKKKKETPEISRAWEAIEESLYLSWSAFHTGKKTDDFYAEQKANALSLTGQIETYDLPVKDRPGDYLLRRGDMPIAYLYSTQVDLSGYVGQTVTILATERPNHHFAFPAYFVLEVEKGVE